MVGRERRCDVAISEERRDETRRDRTQKSARGCREYVLVVLGNVYYSVGGVGSLGGCVSKCCNTAVVMTAGGGGHGARVSSEWSGTRTATYSAPVLLRQLIQSTQPTLSAASDKRVSGIGIINQTVRCDYSRHSDIRSGRGRRTTMAPQLHLPSSVVWDMAEMGRGRASGSMLVFRLDYWFG